jgi:hypothetical protein
VHDGTDDPKSGVFTALDLTKYGFYVFKVNLVDRGVLSRPPTTAVAARQGAAAAQPTASGGSPAIGTAGVTYEPQVVTAADVTHAEVRTPARPTRYCSATVSHQPTIPLSRSHTITSPHNTTLPPSQSLTSHRYTIT